jgi:pimeloyl-ACP methyl ester carboxylesterase
MTSINPILLPAFKSEAGRLRYMAAYDAVLSDWPVPLEEIDVQTHLGATHIVACGSQSAPSVVLLPNFAGTATVWRLNVHDLSQHFRVDCVDVIGQPGKSVATQRLRNRRQLAIWLTEVLDGLRIERTSIAGCSFGGFLALNQASLAPERVERIVLISPVGVFASRYWKLLYTMLVKRTLRRLSRRISKTKRLPSMAELGMIPKDTKWAALMGVTISEAPKVGIIRTPVFRKSELRAIRPRALLLIGDHEKLYEPHSMMKTAQERMPSLQGVILKDADHIAAMAQPTDVNARIIQFLKQP